MLKLTQDGFNKENFSNGYYVSIFPFRDDINYRKELPIDFGWLLIDDNKLVFSGTDYKIELLKSDIMEIFTTNFSSDTRTMFGGKPTRVKYQEKDGGIVTLRLYSKGGMTAPKIKQSNIELLKHMKDWYNASS